MRTKPSSVQSKSRKRDRHTGVVYRSALCPGVTWRPLRDRARRQTLFGGNFVHTRDKSSCPEGRADRTRCPDVRNPRSGVFKILTEGRPGADQLSQPDRDLSMLVNGWLTTPPQVEAVVVTNSVAGFEPEATQWRFRAKAIDLDTFDFSAASRFRDVRSGRRARTGEPSNPGFNRRTSHMPANASHRLSSAREAAPEG